MENGNHTSLTEAEQRRLHPNRSIQTRRSTQHNGETPRNHNSPQTLATSRNQQPSPGISNGREKGKIGGNRPSTPNGTDLYNIESTRETTGCDYALYGYFRCI